MATINILIIDDETDVCNFFRRLLKYKGYQVTTATNEPQALQALEEKNFQVALVDLKLPDTDGLTLLSLIKSRQPHCEVIIMTRLQHHQNSGECHAAGRLRICGKAL